MQDISALHVGGKVGPLAIEERKLISDLEVRCGMLLDSIRADIRQEYQSLKHIALAVYQDIYKLDKQLPERSVIKDTDETGFRQEW